MIRAKCVAREFSAGMYNDHVNPLGFMHNPRFFCSETCRSGLAARRAEVVELNRLNGVNDESAQNAKIMTLHGVFLIGTRILRLAYSKY